MAIQTTSLTTTSTEIFTSVGQTAITLISLCNYSAAQANFTINIVKAGDTINASNTFLKDIDIIPGDTFISYSGGEKIILEDGDIIYAVSNANNSISAIVSYMVI